MRRSFRLAMRWMALALVLVLLPDTSAHARGTTHSATIDAGVIRFDFAAAQGAPVLSATSETPEFAVTAEARYDPRAQTIRLGGTYRISHALAPGALLSYQLYAADGELLQPEGARFAWDDSGTKADFVLRMPILERRPALQSVLVKFDAVVEGEYWYRDRHPNVRFSTLELLNLPRRDEYRSGWTWIPSILPAGMHCVIPAVWSIVHRDAAASGFVASMDVSDNGRDARIDSPRIPFADRHSTVGPVFAWLPLSPLAPGQVELRPGLVWDGVRWYGGDGWFTRLPVTIVPALAYVGGMIIAMALLGAAWSWVMRCPTTLLRRFGVSLLLAGWSWLGVHALVSGTWPIVAMLLATAWSRRLYARRDPTASYVIVWLMLALLEVYWGHVGGVTRVHVTATLFSLAVWAALLLPLVQVRQDWPRRALGAGVVAACLLTGTAAVVHFRFFQDFPSLESLRYAGQATALGDSFLSLIDQQLLIPPLLIAAAFAAWCWPQRATGTASHRRHEC